MRRQNVLALVIVAAMFCPAIAFTQDPPENKEPVVSEPTKEKPIGQEYMGMGMRMMGMMQKQMVATNDGGVILLLGNKLIKYDKDLNLVKEAEVKAGDELKVDAGSMQDMIKMMRGKYGKHGKQEEGTETEKK